MYTLLDTCLDRLDIFEFLSHVEDGLKDHYDIKVSTITCTNTCTITCTALVRSRVKQCNSEKTYGRFRLYFNQALLTLKRRLALLELLVDTTSEKFENGALFLRGLGLSSTLIRLENGVFRRRFPNWRNLTKRFYRVRKTL